MAQVPKAFHAIPNQWYSDLVLITCPIYCTLPSGTTLTVASYHICGKHAFESCVFSIIILIKGFPLPPFPLNASASLQTKEDLGSCAGEKCAAEMHMAISTSCWHPKTNQSICAMVTTFCLFPLKGNRHLPKFSKGFSHVHNGIPNMGWPVSFPIPVPQLDEF